MDGWNGSVNECFTPLWENGWMKGWSEDVPVGFVSPSLSWPRTHPDTDDRNLSFSFPLTEEEIMTPPSQASSVHIQSSIQGKKEKHERGEKKKTKKKEEKQVAQLPSFPSTLPLESLSRTFPDQKIINPWAESLYPQLTLRGERKLSRKLPRRRFDTVGDGGEELRRKKKK